MEMGKSRLQATLDGSKEIGFTIVSMTLSLAAVFIPVLFMGGILGRLLHEFAVTIVVAVLVSGFVSLTLTPMLCSRMLKRAAQESTTAGSTTLTSACSTAAQRSTSARCSACAAASAVVTLLVVLACFVATASCSSTMPKGFLPSDDTGQLFVLHRSRAGHLASTRWSRSSAGRRVILRKIRTSTT